MELLNFIICDDIRTEIGGKSSLMGIYANSITFQITPDQKDTWPKQKRLALFAQFKIIDKDKAARIHSFKIEAKYNDENIKIGEGSVAPPNIEKLDNIILTAILTNFKFKSPGKIFFNYKFSDEDKGILSDIPVKEPFKVDENIIKKN